MNRTFRAVIAYGGTAYYGFQRQREGQPTIQSELERVLQLVVQKPVTILGAGRTDRGVHALGQVITFKIFWQHDDKALLRALNANLPEDIAVLQLEAWLPTCGWEPTFHPRYDARRRAYEYQILNTAVRNPLERNRSWHIRQPLDVGLMNEAAEALVGVHDFATFGQPPKGTNTVREVFVAEWAQQHERLTFRIQANAFLQRMVRSIVGSLKMVGTGDWSVADFAAALQACDRSRSAMVAPAHGLYLVSVEY
ncbi:MAG: tRNA pseudouridine(38-40) synthase TruA [Chloroflexota bacterium]